MKTIGSFFDSWWHVENYSHVELYDWCLLNLGVRGGKYDFNSVSPNHTMVMFRFKFKEDALMFILRFGGNFVVK